MVNDDDDRESNEESFNESGDNLLLKDVPTKSEISQETAAGCSKGGKNWLALICNWHLMKKIAMVVFLWIAYFLCNIAFSTISPFFPGVVRHCLMYKAEIPRLRTL